VVVLGLWRGQWPISLRDCAKLRPDSGRFQIAARVREVPDRMAQLCYSRLSVPTFNCPRILTGSSTTGLGRAVGIGSL
jgi:hypothetical protein